MDLYKLCESAFNWFYHEDTSATNKLLLIETLLKADRNIGYRIVSWSHNIQYWHQHYIIMLIGHNFDDFLFVFSLCWLCFTKYVNWEFIFLSAQFCKHSIFLIFKIHSCHALDLRKQVFLERLTRRSKISKITMVGLSAPSNHWPDFLVFKDRFQLISEVSRIRVPDRERLWQKINKFIFTFLYT